jgi:3-oxoacyl-[acyl-carrier-protein] synthase II
MTGTVSDGQRPVAVSGVGAVSGLGWGVEALWRGLRTAQCAIGPFSRFDHSRHRTHVAAEVPPAPAGFLARAGDLRTLTLADLFALYAAEEALAAAHLTAPFSTASAQRAGVFFGSSTGGMWESERYLAAWLRGPRCEARLHTLAAQQVNGPGDAVARKSGVRGPVVTFSSACASGALALGAALDAVRDGEVDIALAGGADSLCELTYAGFNALRAVDAQPCRPFLAERAGMSLGEGAALLILEPLDRVLARGARPLALLVGTGASCDAHHMTAPDPEGRGAASALRAALVDAGASETEVDCLNTHGTGTPLNDAAEWRALQAVFGERAPAIPLEATKSLVGHLLGSAGAIEAVATVLSLSRGELHPATGHADGPEVEGSIPAAVVRGVPRPAKGIRLAASLSLAFGGANAAIVFRPWTEAAA